MQASQLSGAVYFYPRPPYGGRHVVHKSGNVIGTISIHALRTEGDLLCWAWATSSGIFLSTPSVRRATWASWMRHPCRTISIHALRTEGDRTTPPSSRAQAYFYPRPPYGGRHFVPVQSDLVKHISIHALRTEGDRENDRGIAHRKEFLSTPSVRRATLCLSEVQHVLRHFYPRPPYGGRLSTSF